MWSRYFCKPTSTFHINDFEKKKAGRQANGALLMFVWEAEFFCKKRLLSLTFDADHEYNDLNQ
jgi:hypothetical protein